MEVAFAGAVFPNIILKMVLYIFSMPRSVLHPPGNSPDCVDVLTIFKIPGA